MIKNTSFPKLITLLSVLYLDYCFEINTPNTCRFALQIVLIFKALVNGSNKIKDLPWKFPDYIL